MDVSTSGFYEWRDRPTSATARRRARLATLIKWIFNDSDHTYGHRRIHAALHRQGERLTPELVRSIMREIGLIPCQRRPFRLTTTVAGDPGVSPDLLARDFHADAAGSTRRCPGGARGGRGRRRTGGRRRGVRCGRGPRGGVPLAARELAAAGTSASRSASRLTTRRSGAICSTNHSASAAGSRTLLPISRSGSMRPRTSVKA
jgi:hypothetical protein